MRKILMTALFVVGGMVAGLACSNPDITAPISVTSATGNFGLGVPIGSNPGTWVSYVPHHVTVSAELHFNATAPIGFPGSAQSHQVSAHLHAQVCDEGTTVTIQSGGKMILGNQETERTTETRFLTGTTLVLESGSQLIVDEGSHLIMEEGSTLIFHSGASIKLQGPNARITFRGKVDVRSGAVFTFTGGGKWIFDQQIWQVDGNGNPYQDLDSYWDIHPTSEFLLDGQGQGTHQMLDIVKSFVPKTSTGNTFTKMTLKNGTIRLDADGPMHCFSALDLQNATVTNIGTPKHAGFRLHETGNTYTVQNARFENGDKSLWLHWYGNASNMTMFNCDFANNTTGLHITDGGASNFTYTLCDFADNATGLNVGVNYSGTVTTAGCNFDRNTTGLAISSGSMNVNGSPFRDNIFGIYALISGASSIATSTFRDNVTGAYVHASGAPASLLCFSSSFIENTDGLYLQGGMDVRVECSLFHTNQRYGIHSEGDSETELRLFLNEEAYNRFVDNGIAGIDLISWFFNSPAGLFLDQGFNEFSFSPGPIYVDPSVPPFYIRLDPDGPYQLINSDFNASGDILADNNKMPLLTYEPFGSPSFQQLPEFTPYNFQIIPNLTSIGETPCGIDGPGSGETPPETPSGKMGEDQVSVTSPEEERLRVYPQPVTNGSGITLALTDLEGSVRVSLTGVDGRVVHQESVVNWSGQYTLGMDGVPSGIYLLVLESDRGRAYTQQVVVQ